MKPDIFKTPALTLVRWSLTSPDSFAGSDADGKYYIVGYFDTETNTATQFISKIVEFLGGTDKALTTVDSILPRNDDFPKPIYRIPGHWRRLTARTKFGPVPLVDKQDRTLKSVDKRLYAGARVRAEVSLYRYRDVKTGYSSASIILHRVIDLEKGEYLWKTRV